MSNKISSFPLFNSEKIICNWQRSRLEKTYADYDAKELKDFFFNNLYPTCEQKLRYRKRNRDFIKFSRNWFFRMILSQNILSFLNKVVELNEITERLDKQLAKELDNHITNNTISQFTLTKEVYRELYISSSTYEERKKQIDLCLECYDIVRKFIEEKSYSLEEIIRKIPKIFIKNVGLLHFGIDTYNVCKLHKNKLAEYGEIIKKREMEYLREMFD